MLRVLSQMKALWAVREGLSLPESWCWWSSTCFWRLRSSIFLVATRNWMLVFSCLRASISLSKTFFSSLNSSTWLFNNFDIQLLGFSLFCSSKPVHHCVFNCLPFLLEKRLKRFGNNGYLELSKHFNKEASGVGKLKSKMPYLVTQTALPVLH